jgi:predicted nucleic acid-binding protein
MKIYLDTSVFNYYYEIERSLHLATVQLFKEISYGKFEPYTSLFVAAELKATPDEKIVKRENMLDLIPKYNITVLPENDEAIRMADLY